MKIAVLAAAVVAFAGAASACQWSSVKERTAETETPVVKPAPTS